MHMCSVDGFYVCSGRWHSKAWTQAVGAIIIGVGMGGHTHFWPRLGGHRGALLAQSRMYDFFLSLWHFT